MARLRKTVLCPRLVLERGFCLLSRSPARAPLISRSLSPSLPLTRQEQESDDDHGGNDTATTSHMTEASAPADGTKKDKKAAPRAALDAMLAGEAAINPQVSVFLVNSKLLLPCTSCM